MQVDWNSKQKALFETYEVFGREVIAPRAEELATANQFDQAGWDQLCQLGFFNSILPGVPGDNEELWWDFTAGLEGLASGCCDGGFLLSVISQAGFIRGLSLLGTNEQQGKYFPQIQAGKLSATAIAEPQSGSDLSSLETSATKDSANWSLNGNKWNIAHAPLASFCLVIGRMPELGKRDLTVFLVDSNKPGFSSGPPDEKLGNRTLPTSWLKFENLPLAKADILGTAGDGLRALGPIVTLQRIYYGWMTSRLLIPILEDALDFLGPRSSFKLPLLKHQYIQGKIAETLIGLEQSRWVGIGALHQLLSNHPNAGMQSSIAKLTGVQACLNSARDLLSLLGSNGYQNSRGSRLVKDALGFITVGGTEEMHRINIFNQFMRNR